MLLAAVALVALACGSAGHDHYFKDHPEWNAIWPQSPAAQTNVRLAALPSLSGLWTGSPLGGADHRYWFTLSGGGFGTNKDNFLPKEPVTEPGTSYDVLCLTSEYKGGAYGGCGWDKARCVLSSNALQHASTLAQLASEKVNSNAAVAASASRQRRHADGSIDDDDDDAAAHGHDHGLAHYNAMQSAARDLRATGALTVTATCTFYDANDTPIGSKSGAVSPAGDRIDMDLPWNRFTGNLTGLWYGPPGGPDDEDIYVMSHNATTGELTVWWDVNSTPAGSWTYGIGTYSSNNASVHMHFNSFELKGFANSNFSSISGGDWGSPWNKRPNQFFPSDIHTVHVIFMNHLDVGYASYINNIDNSYFHSFYPLAIRVANEMRALGGTDRLKYITHTWLMSMFYNCPCSDTNSTMCDALTLLNPRAGPLACPTQEEMDNLTAAILRDDISWHAEPFNYEVENMSPDLFRASIHQVRDFDRRFYNNTRNTTVMSVRDVIHITRSVIPYLNEFNVIGLTVGSNGANVPPATPKLHVWREPNTGLDIMVNLHPYGYGGYSKSICPGPGQCGDCAEAPNGVALCTEFRTDNTGPPESTDEVIGVLDAVRNEYPKASVFASTFDAFFEAIQPVKNLLPVITHEIGDTWIYGVPSDPLKMMQHREIQRAWIECLHAGVPACGFENPTIQNMTRFLMKAPEHTWGIPGISGWGGGDAYNKTVLRSLLSTSAYLNASSTWAEQRFFNELAIRALEYDKHPLATEVRRRVSAFSNVSAPNLSGYTCLQNPLQAIQLQSVGVQLANNGSLASLKVNGVEWSTGELGTFVYRTYNESDWVPFSSYYMNGGQEQPGFSKIGSNNYSESTYFTGSVSAAYVSADKTSLVVQLAMSNRAVTLYGCPHTAFLTYTFAAQGRGVAANLTLTYFGKQAIMIGESMSLIFRPAPARTSSWAINKLGYDVDPEDVQDGGNQCNHVTWDGSRVQTAAGNFTLQSLDAPNLNPMTAAYPYGNALPAGSPGLQQLAKGSVFGLAVNIYNDLWNTNYPLFQPYNDPLYCSSPLNCTDANLSFRFQLSFGV